MVLIFETDRLRSSLDLPGGCALQTAPCTGPVVRMCRQGNRLEALSMPVLRYICGLSRLRLHQQRANTASLRDEPLAPSGMKMHLVLFPECIGLNLYEPW